ncbi:MULTISPECIES: phenylacetate--CoA ligase family protein [unclassified Pseudomonas]|uniref:phenylacetate--CoA ligase family protein n=1 Tax=unclassified Pseudomonas TaxID=196821 RepID=UPI002A36EC06|nr:MULTISPECIES: AMP-binding protein [unclassified Pseudomonas]MDX9669268.1 phenylacetate--CoA ligase family protein [Pseudomonas sp. P8_250]WPN36689.1 phenylacetate--CoA ligase family protein [Pseudomonas sp. P8_139]WPN41510.1 phenylacetate--CoA ligase family protein [Pseudomonas sp. P8_229]
MNTTVELTTLLSFTRQHSAYYREHFKDVAAPISTLAELPLIDPVHYWRDSQHPDQWPVLTATPHDALIFKTGGTTGSGKLSLFTRAEWQTLVRDFGRHLTAQLNPGDRVANLFFVGDLYASFIFTHDALSHVETPVCEFPFTGEADSGVLADSIGAYRINVLAGVPAQLLKFAAWLERQSRTLEGVETLLYGGESLFPAQLQLLDRVFPNARIASIGYASVDAGPIGISARDCALGEHRMLETHSVLEIIDEVTGEVIEECNRNGRLVLTNLTRRLMPVIRYPVGDLACWREPAGTPMRKFALAGRSMHSQRVRVGVLSLDTGDIADLVRAIGNSDDWQLLIEQQGKKDLLSLRWVAGTQTSDVALATTRLRRALIGQYPLIEQLHADHLLDLHVIDCANDELACHPRSGKRQRVVDRREYGTPCLRRG